MSVGNAIVELTAIEGMAGAQQKCLLIVNLMRFCGGLPKAIGLTKAFAALLFE